MVMRKADEERDTLRELFDKQIARILDGIDRQLRDLEAQHPAEHVVRDSTFKNCRYLTHLQQSYMVVSGGLGSSDHVVKRLRARYETSPPPTQNAQQMRILTADEPYVTDATL